MLDIMLRGLKQFNLPEIEEKVLKFWKENQIFEKSLRQREGKNPFRFFEGPPTANGLPGMHHVLGRVFKDVVLRYQTMRGHYVLRRAGWDTHGLPVEIEVEKELGLKNKQEIEKFGIAEFNARAKASVWKYKTEWEKLTERVGFWLDFKHPYITYDWRYIETLWWILAQVVHKGLLKKLHKIVPYCPRCQTALSSHELGQPGVYRKTKDPSVYVKFALRPAQGKRAKIKEFLLVWTTTPWTLPANVAVAINPKLTYTKFKVGGDYIWSFNTPPKVEGVEVEVVEKMSGKKLVGLKYEPLYPNLGAHQVLAADFVATEEGSGLVHIAPAFGEDDFRLAGRPDMPVTIDDRGFVKKASLPAGRDLPGAGKFIKEADKDIIADLAKKGLLYVSGAVEHEYPFCWRCSTPLIYFARHSWFIEMSKLRDEMIAANKKINWIPEHIKEGRFGGWLKELKDWAISRERYWGTPLPIWQCSQCDHWLAASSLEDLNKYRWNENQFYIMRHSEADHNVENRISSGPEKGEAVSHLTKKGIEQAKAVAKALKKKNIKVIYASPYTRTKEVAKIIAKETGAKIVIHKGLVELNSGIFNGRLEPEYKKFFANTLERFTKTPPGAENLSDVKRRMVETIKDINSRHQNQNILIVGHGDPLWVMEGALKGMSNEEIANFAGLEIGQWRELEFNNWPYNHDGEIDIHKPFVDEIYLKCPKCSSQMSRIKEVADVWFDSGAMPFAQWHYPFENKYMIDKQPRRSDLKSGVGEPTYASAFPADYIAEGVDQTRGWFYTLLAVAMLLGRGVPYQNVISFGLLLDKNGQKMSKSKGNVVDPWQMVQKYGADTLRWYFYTINAPGEAKKFDEQDLGKTLRKIFLILYNSFVFWETYADKSQKPIRQLADKSQNLRALDKWILSRLQETSASAAKLLDEYEVGEAARLIELLVDDLSRWYIRRSREVFQSAAKGAGSKKEYQAASAVLRHVLAETSKLMAPFAPFFSEALYQSLQAKNSVHLENWPEVEKRWVDKNILEQIAEVRRLAAAALAEREKAGIKVRQPLAKLKVKSEKLKGLNELLNLLKAEINVKEIAFDKKINPPAGGDIELDTKITPELKKEGIIRELVRLVQGLRHDAGYKMGDKVYLMLELSPELAKVIKASETEFKKEVSAKSLEFKKGVKFDAELNTKIEELPVWLAVRK